MKGVSYDVPCYLANAYGTQLDKDGLPLAEVAKNKAIAESWTTLTTDFTTAEVDLVKALGKSWQVVKDAASTIEHTVKFAVNSGATLYRAGETIVDLGIVAKDAAIYVVENAVIPTAEFVNKNFIVPAAQYIGKQPVPSLTTLFEHKRKQVNPIAIEMKDFAAVSSPRALRAANAA